MLFTPTTYDTEQTNAEKFLKARECVVREKPSVYRDRGYVRMRINLTWIRDSDTRTRDTGERNSTKPHGYVYVFTQRAGLSYSFQNTLELLVTVLSEWMFFKKYIRRT